ncbi:MAG: PepSY domain-containing protein [Thiocapsa sp.]|uniref:PepSY domain-containing protein n=1 Tax=Thiocapsa sp. TaxID=2024551 RepID=UPI001BCC13A9|nr:PepSY domain-containing protein [Thiocapsa sp.]QVL47310.1 MAG: PepSY domain-containing protein [Thiocapsa sp.]
MQRLRLTAITVAIGLLSVTGGAFAGDRLDHDEIKQLRETGQILPMGEVMASAQTVQPGQLVEAELEREREDGGYLYEIKILAADGTVHKLYLDAATGEVIKRKEK